MVEMAAGSTSLMTPSLVSSAWKSAMSPALTRVLVVAGALPAANIAGSAPWPASSWSFWSSEACGTVWTCSGSAAFSVEHAPAASFLSSPGTVVFSALLSTVNAEASCPVAAGADVCPVALLPASCCRWPRGRLPRGAAAAAATRRDREQCGGGHARQPAEPYPSVSRYFGHHKISPSHFCRWKSGQHPVPLTPGHSLEACPLLSDTTHGARSGYRSIAFAAPLLARSAPRRLPPVAPNARIACSGSVRRCACGRPG